MQIAIENGSFGYRKNKRIINDLSVTFGVGRHVLLGPNGAGKSTLLSILAGALPLREGVLRLNETLPALSRRERKLYAQNVSWMPQQVTAFPGLRAKEQVAYLGWLKGMTKHEAWASASDSLTRVGLNSVAEKRSEELSGGQLRRLGIASALVHDAKVLLLDEPTVGLDPAQRETFRKLLASLQAEKTIIVATHLVDDLDGSETSINVLSNGQMLFNGSHSEFLQANDEEDTQLTVSASYSRFVSEE